MRKAIAILAMCAVCPNLLAASAEFLGADVDGRPKIRVVAESPQYVFHAPNQSEYQCQTGLHVAVVDGNGKQWCRTINSYAVNTILTDALPLALVGEDSPVEFEYRVGSNGDVNTSEYLGWAPKSAAVSAAPIQSWLDTIAEKYGVTFSASLASELKTASEVARVKQVTVNYFSRSRNWLFFYNGKYIALFNQQAALLGLTHTAYGAELSNPANRVPTDTNDTLRGFFFDAMEIGGKPTTLGPTDMTYALGADGVLTFLWSNFQSKGFRIEINWQLKSQTTSAAVAGLSGRARVEDIDHSNSWVAKQLYFPVFYGMATGSGKQIYVPASNTGRMISTSGQMASGSRLLVSGNYPSPTWQSPFILVSADNHNLLISANDPRQRTKGFSVYEYDDNSAGRTMFSVNPQNGEANVIETSGYVTASPVYGSWNAGTSLYERWLAQQTWGHENTILTKNNERNIDTKLKTGVYWWSEPALSNFNSGTNIPIPTPLRPSTFKLDIEKQKQLIGSLDTDNNDNVAVGFHLYSWWDKNFDTDYPLYMASTELPTQTDPITWSESVTHVESDGSLIAPYINAIGIDISDSPSDSTGIVRNTAQCGVDGTYGWWRSSRLFDVVGQSVDLKSLILYNRLTNTPYSSCFGDKRYGRGRTFAFADPSSAIWQSLLAQNMNAVFETMNSRGIYLDSFPNANNAYDRVTVPQGNGDWIREGFRSMGSTARSVAEAQSDSLTLRKFIAAEYFSELTLPYIDIVFNYERPLPDDMPLLQGVYNPYQMFAGQRPPSSQSVAVKEAVYGRSFVWGYQLGLVWNKYLCNDYVEPICDAPGMVELVDYARRLAKAREMVQTPEIGLVWSNAKLVRTLDGNDQFNYAGLDDWCDDPAVAADSACPLSLPRVRGALWSSHGTAHADMLVLTNVANETIQSTITLPSSWTEAQLVYTADGTGSSLTGGDNMLTASAHAVMVYKAIIADNTDIDADGVGDAADDDDDNDGIADTLDDYPTNAAAAVDTDGDGMPDEFSATCDPTCQLASGLMEDTDNDNDGVEDSADAFPLNATASVDLDTDGMPDSCVGVCSNGLVPDYDGFTVIGTAEGDTLIAPFAGESALFYTIKGGGGDDLVAGLDRSDTLDGGAGNDTASYASATASIIGDLSKNTVTMGVIKDTLIDIENMIGSPNNDTLIGNNASNKLEGLDGNDKINCGNGSDTVSYAHSALGVTINLSLTSQQDSVGAGLDTISNCEHLTGSPFNDTLTGAANGNTLTGGVGDDVMSGGGSSDSYYVDSSGDIINEQTGQGTDTVYASITYDLSSKISLENVVLIGLDAINAGGSSGGNTLIGNDAANILEGRNGNDTLSGQGGNDTLIGGVGVDSMSGGAGRDSFVYTQLSEFASSTSTDVINDFSADDIIDLSAIPDAKTTTIQIERFRYVSTFSTAGAEVRFNATTQTLEFNTDSDVSVERYIRLPGVTNFNEANLKLTTSP